MTLIAFSDIESNIIEIRQQKVIIDSDVAKLYGVETKHVNQAIKNNPKKFPDGYIIQFTKNEWELMKSKFLTSLIPKGGKVKRPNAFTEKGLYMLATILKSPKAVETTLAIIETLAKVKELCRAVNQIQALPENSPKQRSLMEHTGTLIADLIIPKNDLEVIGTETSYEMNFAIFKIKRTVKKRKYN